MLEILEMLFVFTPIELRVIILGCIVVFLYAHFKDTREKNSEKDKQKAEGN